MPFRSQANLRFQPERVQVEWLRSHADIGTHPDCDDHFYVADADRDAGTYVLGKQGSGKSRLLESLIHHDTVTGKAVIVIDPHGDLVDHAVSQMPQGRLADTFVLDALDEAYPFGLNVFATPKPWQAMATHERSQAINQVTHIFAVLWPETATHQHLPLYVRTATIALLSNPGHTLGDMRRFLTNKPFRDSLLQNVSDVETREHWHEHDALRPDNQQQRIAPLLTRLGNMFMGHEALGHILKQRHATVNWRKAIDEHQVVLIKLPTGTMEEEARILGVIMLAQIQAAIFSYADTPERDRPGVSLYVDEFQNFTTPDFERLFSQARKFGGRLTIAHQQRGQLPKYLKDTTETARTIICMALKADDASEMATYFPAPELPDPDNVDTKPVEHLLDSGANDPAVADFIDCYMLPLKGFKKGQHVEIRNPGFDVYGGALTLAFAITNGGDGNLHKPIEVDDPLPFLNRLLVDVMKSGDPTILIYPEIVRGFANGGRGFFAKARHIWNSRDLIDPISYPPALVVPDGHGGTQWTRPPHDSTEQYYHFMYHLRRTMAYLAEHPLLKGGSAPKTGDVAKWLTDAAPRQAFIRSGSGTDVGMVRTANAPAEIAGEPLYVRKQRIQGQTRKRYCHPLHGPQEPELPSSPHQPEQQDATPPQPNPRTSDPDDPDATLIAPHRMPKAKPASQLEQVLVMDKPLEPAITDWEPVDE